MTTHKLIIGDVSDEIKKLESETIDLVLFSPPYYGLRDYGVKGQWGLEKHPKDYIEKFVILGRELKRVLKKSGSMYIVIGDTYFGGHSGGLHSEKSTFRKSKKDKILIAQDYQRRHISDGSNWLQPKNLMLMPSRVAIALQNDGWILRNDIIWNKPNAMPSSVRDRLSNTYEHIFHFVKNRKYFYDLHSIRVPHKHSSIERGCRGRHSKKTGTGQYAISYRENFKGYEKMDEKFKSGELRAVHPKGKNPGDVIPYHPKGDPTIHSQRLPPQPGQDGAFHKLGRNPGDFWRVITKGYNEAHFAVFPERLIIPIIKSSCPVGGDVLDPFVGSGTTMKVAMDLNRNSIGVELNPEYKKLIIKRMGADMFAFKEDSVYKSIDGIVLEVKK